MKKSPSDKYQIVSDRLIELLEKGVKPWAKPWSATGYQNLLSGHLYQGINPLLCGLDCLLNDWDQPYFLGFAQAKEMGWEIKKGSKSTWLRWGGSYAVEEEKDGEKVKSYRNAGKWVGVFNIACFDDAKSDRKIEDFIHDPNPSPAFKPIAELEQLIADTGAVIRYGGDRAFYAPSVDRIQLPERVSFHSVETFYSTAIHELGHWTGHQTRLDRPMCGQFGSQSYAYEELIAELSAAFVGDRYGLSSELENHASYLQSWLKALKEDKKYFFKAAFEARKAAEFLLGESAIASNEPMAA